MTTKTFGRVGKQKQECGDRMTGNKKKSEIFSKMRMCVVITRSMVVIVKFDKIKIVFPIPSEL